ncbi:MAG: zinc-dependent peptidase [Alcaligenaceae bacterium]|nr:zinc-dependent peptidase [Alcaligenaceae bacterium]
MFRWLAGRGATRREVLRTLAGISASQWQDAVGAYPFLTGLSPEEQQLLHEHAAWILAGKSFFGAHGFQVSDAVMLSIAVQAALPVLHLDLVLYEGWTDIVVYPGGFLVPRSDVDEQTGVVHEYVEELAGEAWEGGPLILSWEDAGPGRDHAANVVIHEFAHKLDLHAGDVNGMPSLSAHPQLCARDWHRVLHASFDAFQRAVTQAEDAIPADVDPESDEAAPWLVALPLDPYAASDPGEFFAVSTEAFFIDPAPLAQAMPDWYGLLAQYFRQDPLGRRARVSQDT